MSNCHRKSVNPKLRSNGAIMKLNCRKTLVVSCPGATNKKGLTNQTNEMQDTCVNQVQPVVGPDGICSKGVTHEKRFKIPQMNSILREVKQMNRVEALKPPSFSKDINLTPRSKSAIAPKVNQKLNFNADEVVFKNLTSVNVNDTILIHKQCHTDPNKFKKINKLPSPELYHWLEPQPQLKHRIPEPELTLEFCDTEIDPFESYLHMLK